MENQQIDANREQMKHRQITLADGRYMVFYTFGDSDLEDANGRSVSNFQSVDQTRDREHKDV